MCGIAGFVLRERRAELPLLQAMCDQIRHRGPDDEGFHVDGGCGIGMRRLSIIDLSTGHQPIANEDGSVWVVFNGEIYNFQELRRDLAGRGHRLATRSDTETLVHLYEEDGAECPRRLRGMFAFAIWDAPRRRLLLVRDRFGKKPLYYAALPEGLYFGSEMKCMRAAGVPADLDQDALRLYFQFGYIPDPHSVFRAVRKLPAGSWLVYEQDGSLRQGRYWEPPAPVAAGRPEEAPEEEACERLRRTFDEAVRMRMIADVPLGAFLSGGVDSSCVVASMALQSSQPVKTFSIGFEESRFNELPYAALVAKKYGTEHHQILVRPDSVELITRLVRHFGEPFADSSAIPTFLVSEFAARHVKVALSGDGGDELFAGYKRLATVQRLRLMDGLPASVRGWLSWISERLPYSAYGKSYLRMISLQPGLMRYLEDNYAPYFLRQRLLRPEWMLPADAGFPQRAFAGYLLPEDADMLSQAMYFETAVNLPGDMLVKVDRMSMANSLEVRCPLLDQGVAELAAAIPHAWRIRRGKGKQFLLRALGERLPAELLNRPKMGFGVPLADWFRGPLRELLWDHLTGSRFLDRGFVEPHFLNHLLREHERRRRDNSYWLWALLVLELWFRELEAESNTPAP
jgi:asparagine synthase (glutamine-hydrolysing)